MLQETSLYLNLNLSETSFMINSWKYFFGVKEYEHCKSLKNDVVLRSRTSGPIYTLSSSENACLNGALTSTKDYTFFFKSLPTCRVKTPI